MPDTFTETHVKEHPDGYFLIVSVTVDTDTGSIVGFETKRI